MIELAKIHFFINTQRGTEHLLSSIEDAELVKSFITELELFLREHTNGFIVVGDVTYKRGCLEIIVQLNININISNANAIQDAFGLLANVGGVLGLIDLLTGNYISKTIKFKSSKLHSTISKKEVRDREQLIEDAKKILNKHEFKDDEIEQVIGPLEQKPKHHKL